jgi:hypothetical protein
MNPVTTFLFVLSALFVIVFVVGFLQRPNDPIARLKARFVVLSRRPRLEAEAELLDRVEALAVRFPGKSYEWYLQWLVTDLERAKR